MGNNTIIRSLFVITLIIGTINLGYSEDEHPLLKETEHKFDRLGLDLKGDVFSVVTKKVNHRQEFGQDKITGEFTTDSIVFDQNGRIISRYYNPEIGDEGGSKYLRNREKYIYSGNDVLRINGEIHQYIEIVETDKDSIRYKREFDNQGRLMQETTYINEKPTTQIKFQYIPGGYEVKYYPSLQSDATTYTLKSGVVKITATSMGGKEYPFDTYFLTKEEKLLRNIKYPRLVLSTHPYATCYYSYNAYGDVIKEELVWSSGGRKETKTYSYEYDEHGNWISKMCKDGTDIEWQRREIIYKTPEEIILHFQQAAQDKLKFEDDLQAKGRKYTKLFNSEMKPKYIEALTEWRGCVSAWNRLPISVDNALRFQVINDLYSFTFSDGSEINGIKFSLTDDNDSFFLSDDLRVVLVPRYDKFDGPQWYVAKYKDNWLDILKQKDSIDWVNVYYQKYRYQDDISDEQLEALWREELLRNEPEIHISQYEGNILINKLDDPYYNGFVSPSISSKITEQETLMAYQDRIAQEEAKRKCTFAYHAIEQCNLMQESNKQSKSLKRTGALGTFPNPGSIKCTGHTVPDNIKLEQIVKFEFNGDLYTFIKKDKTVIQDIHFNRMVSDLDYSYHDYGFLSDDKRFALVTHHNYRTNDFIYLVEFEGNIVKSICTIPYKKSKDFVMPQLQK